MTIREQGDAELIVSARKGDSEAFGELYRRHVDSARAAARALTRSRSDADDITSEAFARVLRALQGGGGPDVSFRPYLITAVRNVFYDRVRRSREQPTADLSDEVNVALLDAAQNGEDGAFAAAAFATLPERWQLVLWHTEVEGKSVSEVAPLLGLAPNAVAALAYRAREGLRQAFLQAHLRDQQQASCRECSSNLGAYVRDGLSARDRRKVDAHLDGCPTCRGLVGELAATNTTLRAALIPALLGVPAATYLSGLGGGGVVGWFTRLPKKQQQAGGAVAAAAVLAVLALVGAAVTGDNTAAPASSAPATVPGDGSGDGSGDGGDGGNGGDDGGDSVPPVTDPASTSSAPTSSAPTSTSPSTRPGGSVPVSPPRTTAPPSSSVPGTTVPTTNPPPTSTSSTTSTTTSTTLPPPPAQLNAVASQRTAALAGGELQIEVTLTNPGTVAASGIVLNLPVPAGATFSRTQSAGPMGGPLQFTTSLSAGWSCTGAVSCTYASLPAGQQTSVVLVFTVSPSATGTLTLTPAISAPLGAVVNSTPVTVSISQIPGLLVAETRAGAVQGVGNSVVTCNGTGNCAAAQTFTAPNNNHTGYTMQYVNTAGGTFNSSSADLALAGTVAHAFLVWSGDTVAGAANAPNAAGRNTVSFTTPSGTSTVSADQLFDAAGGIYTAYADVTSLVAANGTYSVADIQTAAGVGTFGGWSLVVVVHNSSMPERLLMAIAPLATVSTSSTYSFTFPVPVPMVNASATWLAVGFEGDYDLLGDSATLAGAPVANPFRSEVPGTRNPSTPNTMGTDLAIHNVSGLNGSSMGFTAATSNDQVQLGFLAIALDL